VNSHWHLDHVGRNPPVKAAYPGARVYVSSALDDALTGFVATYRGQLLEMMEKTPDPHSQEPWRAEIALIDAGHALGPDEVVSASGERLIARREFRINLEPHAVTASDVWLFDPRSRVLAAGDLITLPVPFLDTACRQGWNSALDHVAATDFSFVIPGHGAPMRLRPSRRNQPRAPHRSHALLVLPPCRSRSFSS
jgi:glyoxylase-like metal-dependent hydrolase (beta-lactamase superfamily II)